MKVYIVLVDLDYEKYWEVKGVFRNKESAEEFSQDYKTKKKKAPNHYHIEVKIEGWDVLN